jgi:hypothetical protein
MRLEPMAIAQEQHHGLLPESFIIARTVIDGISPVIPMRGECSSDTKPTSHQEGMWPTSRSECSSVKVKVLSSKSCCD